MSDYPYSNYTKYGDEGSLPDPLVTSEYGTRWATMEERLGHFEHCSPDLYVDCADTPRRSCECDHGGSHDHLIHSDNSEDFLQ